MATARKKKSPKLKFELSRMGVAGIAIVVFCVFLWMFLLGVWVGQKVLFPTQPQISNIETTKTAVKEELLYLDNNGKRKKKF